MWASVVVSTLFVAGCASVEVIGRDDYQGEKLARPDRILVHDFAVTAGDLPDWSEASKEMKESTAARSDQEIVVGRRLGAQMAEDLVVRIRKMGLGADRTTMENGPVPGDIVIVGYLTSIDQGSSVKRVVIGFGSGSAEISTQLEGYLASAEGLVKLSSGRARSVNPRGPGVAVPIAMTIITANPISLIIGLPIKVAGELTGRNALEGVSRRIVEKLAVELEKKFEAQGWID